MNKIFSCNKKLPEFPERLKSSLLLIFSSPLLIHIENFILSTLEMFDLKMVWGYFWAWCHIKQDIVIATGAKLVELVFLLIRIPLIWWYLAHQNAFVYIRIISHGNSFFPLLCSIHIHFSSSSSLYFSLCVCLLLGLPPMNIAHWVSVPLLFHHPFSLSLDMIDGYTATLQFLFLSNVNLC